jgi:hypothetical protein
MPAPAGISADATPSDHIAVVPGSGADALTLPPSFSLLLYSNGAESHPAVGPRPCFPDPGERFSPSQSRHELVTNKAERLKLYEAETTARG